MKSIVENWSNYAESLRSLTSRHERQTWADMENKKATNCICNANRQQRLALESQICESDILERVQEVSQIYMKQMKYRLRKMLFSKATNDIFAR